LKLARFSPRAGAAAAALLLSTAFGCSGKSDLCMEADASGTQALVADPSGTLTHFFDHPWPSDARRTEDGRLRLHGFPNPTGSSTLDDYVTTIEQNTHAFGRNAAIYASFTGALDPSSLPPTPRSTTSATATLFLVDVDPSSPENGRRIPLNVRFGGASIYLPPNNLVALPPFGIPLRDKTSYALVGTTGIKDSAGKPIVPSRNVHNALLTACTAKAPAGLAASLAPLKTWLEGQATGPQASDVAFATVFTTQNVVAEMRQIGAAAEAEPTLTVSNWTLENTADGFFQIRGEVDIPSFQKGKPPFAGPMDGGGINFSATGSVSRDHYEHARVGFAIPTSAMPAGGWPVVLYAHGTGGSYADAFDPPVGKTLTALGLAVMCYDGVAHGPRVPAGTDPNVTFFNLFNIVAGRDNVRQGGADNVVMTKLLRSGLSIPTGVASTPAAITFDRDKVAFLGHSQGGLVGAPYNATESGIKAAVFSGTAGILTITLLVRKYPLDFPGLIRTLLQLPDSEMLDEMHPVLNLLQTFIEPADAVNYGASYLSDPAGGVGRDMLLIEGFNDMDSPAAGHEAFAAAARIPVVSPYYRTSYVSQLLGLAPQQAPVMANVTTPDGNVTAGQIQYPHDNHFALFDNPDANMRYAEFLRSALLDGRARIVDGHPQE
jgi:hypothetical protein